MAIIGTNELKSRVAGCWMGKNIGGTLGAPFEGKRGTIDLDFYTQELIGQASPNDDVDLQLVWLLAVEEYGRAVNASILGEYWHSFVVPNWNEYGVAKANLRAGLVPPLSGWVHNPNRDSCGAFIRSEIWACLAPGHPEIATRFAYEDSIVDHSDEGVYGEVFCAAVQSAAFVESDPLRLIDIGLSYLPEGCGVARGVRCVLESKRKGDDWRGARNRLLREVPDAFFYAHVGPIEEDLPRGPAGYDAPANVGIFVLGWLYGEGDFGRSLCIAVGCGEDTDCTAATLGATLGIIAGLEQIPARWKDPIGDGIQTISLNRGDQGQRLATSVTELTERILRQVPAFLGANWVDVLTSDPGYTVRVQAGMALRCQPEEVVPGHYKTFQADILERQPYSPRYDTPLYTCWLQYEGDPRVSAGVPYRVVAHVENRLSQPQWLTLRWIAPLTWTVAPAPEIVLSLSQRGGGCTGTAQVGFEVVPDHLGQASYDLFLDIRSHSRHTRLVIPVTLHALTAGESRAAEASRVPMGVASAPASTRPA